MDPVGGDALPVEVALLVLEWLDVADLSACMAVSTRWREVAQTNSLWLALHRHHFPHLHLQPQPSAPLGKRRRISSFEDRDENAGQVQWRDVLRHELAARRNWQRGRPMRRDIFTCQSRVSSLCFDERYLYAGLNRGTVQVFDLLKEDDVMEEVAEPKVVLEREYTDSDSEDEKSDESALFFFSNEVIPGVSRNRLHHTVTVPAKGRRQKGTVLHSAPHSSMFDAMARYQNGLFATSGRNITVWNVDAPDPEAMPRLDVTYDGHINKVSCLDFHDNTMFTGSWDRTVRIWNIDTGQCLHSMTSHTANVKHLQVIDSNRIVTSANDNTIVEWDIRSCSPARITSCTLRGGMTPGPAVSAFSYDPARDMIVIGQRDGTIQRLVYSAMFAKTTFTPDMPGSAVMHLHKSLINKIIMDSYKVISSGHDGVIGVWDLASGKLNYKARSEGRAHISIQADETKLFFSSSALIQRLCFLD